MNKASQSERIVITGMGAVSPAGGGAGELFEALCEKRDMVRDLSQPWAQAPHHLGAPVTEFNARNVIPVRRLRRINRISQMAVVAACEALEWAKIKPDPGMGVVIGTGLGALQDTMEFLAQLQGPEPQSANPALFPSSVMNVAASHIAMELGLQGYNTTINHKEISAELALMVAVDMIRLGHIDMAIVGGVDELSQPAHHGYRRLGALATGHPLPFGLGRDGMVLGEGACMLLLERASSALARGAPVLAEVRGVGIAGGARPLTSWGPAWEGGRRIGPSAEMGAKALDLSMAQAGITPQDVDFVVSSACGSPELDLLEAQVLARVFGDRPVPVTSPHGSFGSWMAGGALRLLAATSALVHQRIFPTLTTETIDSQIKVPGLVTTGRRQEGIFALVCGHATGGGSMAIVLEAGGN